MLALRRSLTRLRPQLCRSTTNPQLLYKCQEPQTLGFSTSSSAEPSPVAPAAEVPAKKDQDPEGESDVDIPPEVTELFETLRLEAVRRLDEFAPIHLFSLCWAYSTARLLDDELQKQITGAALRLGRKKDSEATRRAPRASRSDPPAQLGQGDPLEAETADPAEAASGSRFPEFGEPYVAKEGRHWLAIYKPPHWQVSVDSKEAAKNATGAAPFQDDDEGDGEDDLLNEESKARRPRIQTWIRQNLADRFPICTDSVEAFGLLHRLDAQTSGLLVCAKSYEGSYWLRLQWCSYMVDKEYICLVHGWVDRGVREINKRIRVEKRKAPNSRRTVSTFCTVGPSGKPSYTELFTLAHLKRTAQSEADGEVAPKVEHYSLVALKLHTGRTHQIRVHMQSIDHPLVTDSKYAEDRVMADKTWCPRNFLHTYRLAFRDLAEGTEEGQSDAGEIVELRSPLPEDLRGALVQLEPVDEVSRQPWNDWVSGKLEALRAFDDYIESGESPAS